MEWGRPESKPRAGAPEDRLPAQLPLTLGMRVTCKSQGMCQQSYAHTWPRGGADRGSREGGVAAGPASASGH